MPTTVLAPKPKPKFDDFGPELSYTESVKSATAIRRNIANEPAQEYYDNMVLLFRHVIKPIFNRWGKKYIPSFYRSLLLNKAIGGATNSQHTRGQAVDIDCDGLPGITNPELFKWVRANIDFDQLIGEFGDEDGNFSWLHISYVSPEKNRHNVLIAVKENGKTVYKKVA